MATFPTVTPFRLVEIVVAPYTAFGDYGTPVSLDLDQLLSVEPQADTDQMRDSGAIVDGLAVPTHAKITLGYGGMTLEALNIIIGTTSSSTGAIGNRVITRNHDANSSLPYFAAIGVAETREGGYKVVCLPKVLLDTRPKNEYNGKENKFVISDTSGMAFADGANNRYMIEKDYEALADYTSPATAEEFEAFFA